MIGARRVRSCLVAILLATFGFQAACDEDMGADAVTEVQGTDVAFDGGADTSGEATSDADDGGSEVEADTGPAPELVIGFNLTGTNTPADYTPLTEGASLNIEYGPQGLWMVVLAFRTRGVFEPKAKLNMEASCTTGDTVRGELALAKQSLLPGGDGYDYYYNLFLVVDEVGASGKNATIVWTVEDPETGAGRTEMVNVQLTGGP